jgi:hypothetical protein
MTSIVVGNKTTDIRNFIDAFVINEPSYKNDWKPTRVRVFERNKSVEDFSISYRVDKNDKDLLKGPVFNFTVEKAVYNGVEGYIIKKVSKKSTTDVFVSSLPVRGDLKTVAKRRILELHFECDVIYTATGKRRYEDKELNNHGSENT